MLAVCRRRMSSFGRELSQVTQLWIRPLSLDDESGGMIKYEMMLQCSGARWEDAEAST